MRHRSAHLRGMRSPDLVTVHARHPAGVSTATFSFERDGGVIGHAVQRPSDGDRVLWHVTDRVAPPFVVEQLATDPAAWLLTRPDGAPFARIVVTSTRPLDVVVLDGQRHLVRVHRDGTLTEPRAGTRLGRIDLSTATDGDPAGTRLELPVDTDPVLRAALLTLPFCLSSARPPTPRRRG
jgi:hypothetical protein